MDVNFKVLMDLKNMLKGSETKQMPTLTGTKSIKHMELSQHFRMSFPNTPIQRFFGSSVAGFEAGTAPFHPPSL